MLLVKCDICKEVCSYFYVLEKTSSEIRDDAIREFDLLFSDGDVLYKRMHLCENCMERIDACINGMIKFENLRVDNTSYNERRSIEYKREGGSDRY